MFEDVIPSILSSVSSAKYRVALGTGTDRRVRWDWVENCCHMRNHSGLSQPPRDPHRTPTSVK